MSFIRKQKQILTQNTTTVVAKQIEYKKKLIIVELSYIYVEFLIPNHPSNQILSNCSVLYRIQNMMRAREHLVRILQNFAKKATKASIERKFENMRQKHPTQKKPLQRRLPLQILQRRLQKEVLNVNLKTCVKNISN